MAKQKKSLATRSQPRAQPKASAAVERPRPRTRAGSESAASAPTASRPARADRRAERREAILLAALDEFAARGFAATRLDDVAKRAGVAKGTIYLYVDDKEALFQELVRQYLIPQVTMLEQAPVIDLPVRQLIERFMQRFLHEIYTTRRRDVLRLILTEGQRFPHLAEFYYHEVIARALAAIRAVLARAIARGELPDDALVRFPLLLVSPLLMSILWSGLFERFAPLDVPAMVRAHLDIIFGERTSA